MHNQQSHQNATKSARTTIYMHTAACQTRSSVALCLPHEKPDNKMPTKTMLQCVKQMRQSVHRPPISIQHGQRLAGMIPHMTIARKHDMVKSPLLGGGRAAPSSSSFEVLSAAVSPVSGESVRTRRHIHRKLGAHVLRRGWCLLAADAHRWRIKGNS